MECIIGLKDKFSFWFLNCDIGQPSQPVSAKLPSSSCLEPWPHPGKGTLPMTDQAGKRSSERNWGYTRPKGPFHPAEGQGVNCPLSGSPGSGPAWEEQLLPQGKQCSCTASVHITAELVTISLFVHFLGGGGHLHKRVRPAGWLAERPVSLPHIIPHIEQKLESIVTV